jgi:hypothetical protein
MLVVVWSLSHCPELIILFIFYFLFCEITLLFFFFNMLHTKIVTITLAEIAFFVEHKTLKCMKFKTGTNWDYWLGTTETEHSMKENINQVSIKWLFHYNYLMWHITYLCTCTKAPCVRMKMEIVCGTSTLENFTSSITENSFLLCSLEEFPGSLHCHIKT